MAPTQASLVLSKETPNTSKPLSLYSWYNLTTFGFSSLQGLHQAAQKSINTYFPLKSDNRTISPSGLGRAISGAGCPTESVLSSSNCCFNVTIDFVLGYF